MTKKGKGRQKKLQRKVAHIKSKEAEKSNIPNEVIAAMHGGWKTPDHKSAHIGKTIKD